MHNFDIAKLDDYTITQLADFVIAGKTTVKDLFDGGLSPYCRPKLLKELEFRYKKAWQEAEEKGSVESFNDSIVVYDCQPPRNLVTHAQENDQAIPMKTVPMDQLHDAKSGESIEILNDALKTTCNTSTKSVSETVNRKSSASNVSNSASVTQTSSGQENADSQDSVNPGMLSPGKSIGKQDRLKKDTAIYRFVKKWGKACLAGIVAIVIIPVVVHFATKKGSEDYLSQDRIEAIIKNYQDSLKNEIFDGFYLVPAVWDGIQRDYPIQLPEVGKKEVYVSNAAEGVLDSIHAKSPQDVFDRFKGRHNVVNNDGVVMPLPGIANGIDSLLIVDKPFIEYLDDNGIRRVVALLNNDIYYFAGYCGSHDNFRQYVMIDRNGKYGLVDENGTVIKDFFNDEIAPSANNYYIKNGGEKQYYSFAGKPLDESPEKSQDNTRQLKVEHYYGNTYPKKSAFIDPSGRVVAIFDNISCYSHKGFYEVRGPNGYGIYNANLQKIEVPLKYEDISEDGADVNLFPAKKNGKWGYVSGGGVESIGFRFKNAYSFDPDTKLACVKDEVYADKYGYIDVSGNYKILPQYDSAGKMTRCGARVMRSNGDVSEYGYITTSGKIITSWYPYMGNRFVLDRIFVRDSEGLGGFIDKNDKLVIPYQFEETEPVFNEITHLAKVRFKGMDWYINTNGAFAIPESIYVFKPDKSDGRHRETDRKTNGKTGRTVAEKVAPTEQSIPDLIVKIADSFESAELESSNDNGKESEIPRWSKHDGKESEAPRGSRW